MGKDTPESKPEFPVTERRSTVRSTFTTETALLLGFLFVGLVLLPVAIYLVGKAIFGEYGGGSFGHFYSELSSRVRGGDFAAWFLVLSPYLGWQALRLIGVAWRLAGRRPQPRGQ